MQTRHSTKIKTLVLLLQAAALCAIGAERSQAVAPAPEEMGEARQWAAAKFEGDEPFFSFTYDGRPSAELLKTWKSERASEQLDDQRTRQTLTYTDPETGLALRCVGIEYGDYLMRSDLTPLPTLHFDMRRTDRDYTLARRVVDQWRQLGRYYLGDYYPLTPYSLDENVWMAWQFNCPESGEGLVQAFRRQDSPEGPARLKLHGLQEDAVYTLMNLDDVSSSIQVRGRELLETGLSISIPERPADVLITYAKGDP